MSSVKRGTGVKIRSSEKDQLIAELRQQLYDLRNQDRDYRGVNDEIFAMENRYRMLADDRARGEQENRARLDRGSDEVADARKQLDDLKYLLQDKSKQNLDLSDEQARSKRLLDEKYFEAGRLRDESISKGDQCADSRSNLQDLEREIESVKIQRAEMWREITRLKELNENKAREANDQSDKLKNLDFEVSRTQSRIEETQKLVDQRSADLRSKQLSVEDTERELARVRDANSKVSNDTAALRRDNDRVAAENYDLRKEVEFQEGRNADNSLQIRDAEMRLKEREESLFVIRRDIECQRVVNSQNQNNNGDLTSEKEALEKHAACLQGQNVDLTTELDRFCQTDEVLRGQLDRRTRVYGMQNKNQDELRTSYHRVEDARSRSPQRRSPQRY